MTQIISLLTTPPGNLIYHLVLAFSIAGALQGAIAQWRLTQFPQTRRLIGGLTVLLMAQIVIFMVSALIWQNMLPTEKPLQVLDRATMLFSLVWIIWLWAFPEKSPRGDAATVLLSLLTIVGMFIGIVAWAQNPIREAFNYNVQDMIWQGTTLVIIVVGAMLLGFRKPNAWITGLTMLLLLFIGHLLQLALPNAGNYPGYVRLFALLGYPILLTLPHRFPTPVASQTARPDARSAKTKKAAAQTAEDRSLARERRRYSTDPKAFATLLNLAAANNRDEILQHLTHSVAQSILADLCFLLFYDEERGLLQVASGYDLIREEFIDPSVVSASTLPLLSNAIKRQRPLRLPASGTSPDIQGLSDLLGLTSPGHLLSIPLAHSDGSPWGAFLLLAPYSERLWSSDDQAYLTNVANAFTPILERAEKLQKIETERQALQEAYDNLRVKVDALERTNAELAAELDKTRQQAAQPVESHAGLEAFKTAQKEAQQIIARLRAENEALRQGVALKTDQQLESELRLTLEEVARLQNALAEANMRILELERSQKVEDLSEEAELIAAIAQELRQPMSSIIGYTDLLLGESVGILGALQRKFVERIKASTERIGSLIDDLINILNIETGGIEIAPESVDINLVIDNAIAYTGSALRQKNITLQIDIPKDLKTIHADREALQQILIHLLQNAGACTPEENSIYLSIRPYEEEDNDYILIQVKDHGGGIASEDFPRVFSRMYRANNSLIEGVGDTGVGLSIAKTLTEAHGGRIWVESEDGVGATFSVILPANPAE